jgi:hypothetical protein
MNSPDHSHRRPSVILLSVSILGALAGASIAYLLGGIFDHFGMSFLAIVGAFLASLIVFPFVAGEAAAQSVRLRKPILSVVPVYALLFPWLAFGVMEGREAARRTQCR